MRPDRDPSRASRGEASAAPSAQAQAPQAASARPTRRSRRRVLALGAGAVLALTGTVIWVAAAGMPSGRGAVAGPVRAGQAGAVGQPSAYQPGPQREARRQAARHQAAAGTPGVAGTGGALRTSCRSVAHIGDSTSVDLTSAAFLPDASQRLAARYRAVGVRHLRIDASGGRSIVEELPGQRNGYSVASGWRGQGYRGCWVFALGTNDAANVSVGSATGLAARIDRMMAVAHGQPVLWVNTKTELNAGPWSEANQRAWDAALTSALARYPNMRIFNWAAVARPAWFLPDGIHYNSAGCAARASAIADALARAFPAGGHSKGKVVL